VARQRGEVGLFLAEPLEAGPAVAAPQVDDLIEPVDELGAYILEVAKRAAIEERPLEVPERPLGARLGIGLPAHRARLKLIMSGECQKPRIVDRSGSLTAATRVDPGDLWG